MNTKIREFGRARFIIINSYPNMWSEEVGDIVKADHEKAKEYRKFPHVYHELDWWEYRMPELMPEYVTLKEPAKEGGYCMKEGVMAVRGWEFSIGGWRAHLVDNAMLSTTVGVQLLLPSNESDYSDARNISRGKLERIFNFEKA